MLIKPFTLWAGTAKALQAKREAMAERLRAINWRFMAGALEEMISEVDADFTGQCRIEKCSALMVTIDRIDSADYALKSGAGPLIRRFGWRNFRKFSRGPTELYPLICESDQTPAVFISRRAMTYKTRPGWTVEIWGETQ